MTDGRIGRFRHDRLAWIGFTVFAAWLIVDSIWERCYSSSRLSGR